MLFNKVTNCLNDIRLLNPFCSIPCPNSCDVRALSTSGALNKNVAEKYYNKRHKFKVLPLTYSMTRRPHHIGHHKSWMTLHSQNLMEFKQRQAVTLQQDEVIRRFIRAILFPYLPDIIGPTELVIKRRANVVYVTGFLVYSFTDFNVERLYWLWGFTEEILANLLKQPVRLELQFVRDVHDLAVSYVLPK